MKLTVDIQNACDDCVVPSEADIARWVSAALHGRRERAELTVRFVGEPESRELNERWRKRAGPTNVLSFSAAGTQAWQPDLLGDLVICAPIVEKEARQQKKQDQAHWAHMVVHGTLHLLGHDHENDLDANSMETFESRILEQLGYPNPYD